jgi:DNA-binding GntR family transcriptional regulator
MAQTQTHLPAGLFTDLDRSAPQPLYLQVAERIEHAITDGDLPPGSRLENEVALGDRLGISRPTIRHAIQDLVDKGLLVRRRGIGTQVVHGSVTRTGELTSLFDELTLSGRHPASRVLLLDHVTADAAVSDALGVPAGSEVTHVRRLRSADGVPIAILENFLPLELDGIVPSDLEANSLYALLRSRGANLRVARQNIAARAATGDEAALLSVDDGAPLLTVERIAYDTAGYAVDFGRHCYRPDLYSLQVTLVEK